MNFLKRVRWVYLLLSLVLMAAGVCLVLWPNIPMETACLAAGIGAMVYGLLKIVIYFVREVEHMVEQYDFSAGLLCILAGCFLVIHPAEIIKLIPQVVALYVLCDCIFKLQVCFDAKRLEGRAWILMLLVTLLVAAWGGCLLLQPFGLDAYASILLAGGLIADGFMNLLAVIFIAAVVRKPAAEGGPVPKVPDPAPVPAVVPVKDIPTPTPDFTDEEATPQVKDLLAESWERSKPSDNKSSVFSFFHRKKDDASDGTVPGVDFDVSESEDVT